MDTILNVEGTLEKEIQHLVALLVKQQVQKELQLLEKNLLPNLSTHNNKEQNEKTPAEAGLKTENPIIQPVKKEPKKICTEKLKVLIQQMTPTAKRRNIPLLVQARMLMKLYDHPDYGITPDELFSYAGSGKRAGQRYVSFFKDRDYLSFIGARQNGKYILTDKGRKLLENL